MNHPLRDNHDLGLRHDLEAIARQMRARRQLLGWIASAPTIALIAACGGGSASGSGSNPGNASTGGCIADPEETAGPFPSDGSNSVRGSVSNVLQASGIVRGDIRGSFGGSTAAAPGVPLTLTLSVVNTGAGCAPLPGYAVYLWHCTRDGNYSLYSSAIRDENYLRGVQVADDSGRLSFRTIFPGCYSGRYPHIHFEVYPDLSLATGYTNRILTSQMAMPRDICSTVYSGATGYGASVRNLAALTTSSDNVFGDNTAAQIAAQTPTLSGSVDAGYTGSIVIGVAA